ncbi:MAG: hypothetical protein E7618_04615 [Ruminococcaceae bacterium]|nr:hypothetical protein [Oscillospiraceae bacterium]
MKKTFAILMALSLVLSAFGFMGVSAATTPWDGVTADINWYLDDTDADTFVISNANEWAGLVEIVAAYNADEGEVKKDSSWKGEAKLYYDENGFVVTDPAKKNDTRVLLKGDAAAPLTNFNGKTVKLAADIDLNNKDIKPLGYPKNFEGTLDGQNHTIKNLNTGKYCSELAFNGDRYIYGTVIYVGVNGTVVKDLNVENAVLDLTVNKLVATPASQFRLFVGGLVGYTNGRCVFNNVTVNGLTVNVNATETATQRILWGIFTSVLFKATEPEYHYEFKDITITGYTFNANGYSVGSIISSAKDENGAVITDTSSTKRLFGMNMDSSGTLVMANNSVTYGEYVPTPETQAPVTQAPTTQAPSTSDNTPVPPQGDSVVAIVALAAVAVAGIAFVSKKRKED